MKRSSEYSEGSQVSEYIPNHEDGKPKFRKKDAYKLSPESDQPDWKKDQIVYMENKKNGMTFVDSDKVKDPDLVRSGRFGIPPPTLHMRAFMLKKNILPKDLIKAIKDIGYPIAGGSVRSAQVKVEVRSATYNSDSRRQNGNTNDPPKDIVSKRFKTAIEKHLGKKTL